jgi:O-antigen/teichoic acid export membrane protein
VLLRRVLIDSLTYGATNALTRGIALALIPFYTRMLAPSELGVVDLIAVLGNLANLVLAMEVSQAVARYFPPASAADKVNYASTALWFTLGAYSVALSISLLAAAPLAGWIFDAQGNDALLYIALPALWANGVFYFLQNQLRWQLQPRAYALASLICAATSATVSVLLILYSELGVTGVFWGQLAGALAASSYCLVASAETLRPRFDRAKLCAMLRFSAPLVVSSVAALATQYADRIVIKEFMSIADLGIYGVAQRLAAIISLVLAGFQATITPLVTRFSADPSTPEQIAHALRYFLAIALPALLGLSIFSRELVMVFATPVYAAAHGLFPILALAALLAGMYVFAPGLWLARKTRQTMAINLAAAAVSIGLSLAFVPRFGLGGAAVATLLSAGAGFAAQMVLGGRHFPVPMQWARTLAVLPLLAALLWISAILGESSFWTLVARAGLFSFGAAAMAAIVLGAAEMRRIMIRLAGMCGRQW